MSGSPEFSVIGGNLCAAAPAATNSGPVSADAAATSAPSAPAARAVHKIRFIGVIALMRKSFPNPYNRAYGPSSSLLSQMTVRPDIPAALSENRLQGLYRLLGRRNRRHKRFHPHKRP
jgi:hypothetical protein